ncbi:MAG: hypothetical protein A3A80_00065 [Candidatus Terrybacteria bacterium RIFCSPLOWO2_01_FULL_44_24]|nr:MAG: hypothetical protein A3B75_00930 [Candidatus Terrybacteria bacterium RIFCSPHIGHO2_02_FULL_43_14]OHA51079.1 MAG: hypothetical protein A3A80_00065 [Candidatus Terrybacteria bacterium RIFCSPLOWO2_01_FULL_44_24]
MPDAKFKILNSEADQRGVVVLAMVIIIVSITVLIGISLARTSFFELASGSSEAKTEEALRAADAGIQDALIQLVRNPDFLCTGSGANCTLTATCTVDSGTDGYALSVGNGTACVKITNPSAPCPETGLTIKSRGTISNKIRKIQVTFDFDSNCGITQTAWTELTS